MTESPEMVAAWTEGRTLAVHHNHPSGGPFSWTDWRSLANADRPVEMFVHTLSGTACQARVLDHARALRASTNPIAYDFLNEANRFTQCLHENDPDGNHPCLALHLPMHAVGLAMLSLGWIEYRHKIDPDMQGFIDRHHPDLMSVVAGELAKWLAVRCP